MKLLAFCVLACGIPNVYPFAFESIFRIVRSKVDEIIDKSGNSTQCAKDIQVVMKAFIHRELWALEMVDASGKGHSGLLAGNIHITGNYDQCLNIHEEKVNTIIDGQYCTVTLMPNSNDMNIFLDTIEVANFVGLNIGTQTKKVLGLMKVMYGLCIPLSCTIGNLQSIWDYIEFTFRIPFHVAFVDSLCRSKGRLDEHYPVDFYIIGAFGVYTFILLVSTFYDILIPQNLNGNNDQFGNYLKAFSIYTNIKKLFTYSGDLQDGRDLKCINGMKVISMCWIIYGHRIVINMFSPNMNGKYVFQWWKNIENTPVMAGSFGVDTFFVLSGLLLSYVFLKNQDLFKERGMPIGKFYMYRFIRLSPALLATVLFYISIFKRIGDGPAWPMVVNKLSKCCYKFWWATILFISNFIPLQYQCIEQSWYLAVDTQLYLISPLILKNLIKYPKKTSLACAGACIASAIYTYIITIQNEYGAMYFEGDREFYQHIYLPTFIRMPAWLIGIMMGYFIFKYKQISVSKFVNMSIWIFSLNVMAYIVLCHVSFTRNDYDPYKSAIFNATARQAWAFSVSVIVFLCVTGHGGVINKFLSLPIFQILVRLTYSMYLVHIGYLLYFFGVKKNVGYFYNLNSIHEFIGDLFFTFIIATVWCLAFEAPFLNISKIMIQKEMSGQVATKAIVVTKHKPLKKKRFRKNYMVWLYNYEDKKFE